MAIYYIDFSSLVSVFASELSFGWSEKDEISILAQ